MIVRRTVFILFLLAFSNVNGQLLDAIALDSVRTFNSLEKALLAPDMAYRLDLSGKKLKELPEGIRDLKNLNALDLGNNKLKVVPEWLGELKNLQELRIAKNRLVDFPVVICQLIHLKRLDLSRNALTGLPPCIGELTEMTSFDLWSNDLAEFPEEMEKLDKLRFMDLRAIMFEEPEMERIEGLVPKAKVYFSQPCNCGM